MLYYSLLFLNEWWKWIFQDRLPSVSCPSWDGFFIIDKSLFRSIVLDYDITINKLREADRIFVGGSLGNYSLAGFEMILRRHVSHYIINYYLPSGLFVVVSWISFLVPADIIPGTIQYTITIRKKQALLYPKSRCYQLSYYWYRNTPVFMNVFTKTKQIDNL